MELQDPTLKEYKALNFYLDRLGWMIVILCWGFVFFHYNQLPNTIPTHFNASGVADGFSTRATIFLLPAVLTILYGGLTILHRYPQTFNYPVEITNENKTRQYKNAQSFLVAIKFALSLVFSLITYFSMRAAVLQQKFIPIWLLPLILVLILLPVFIFLIRSSKNS